MVSRFSFPGVVCCGLFSRSPKIIAGAYLLSRYSTEVSKFCFHVLSIRLLAALTW